MCCGKKRKYVSIWINGKSIDEHRHIMQVHLERKLKTTEYIHHINGNKHDNRLENLEIIFMNIHQRMHNKKEKK